MCICSVPNINGQEGYSWDGKEIGVRKPAPPELKDNDVLLFDEPGRCDKIDSHCHHYRIVKNSRCFLLARNGSGDQRIRLSNGEVTFNALKQLDSNGRYWLLNAIFHAANDAKMQGMTETGQYWRQAAAEKRIKTRKLRNQDGVKVWIEPALTPA